MKNRTNPRDYTQLSGAEREKLFQMTQTQMSLRAIAKALNRSPSTISRELARNTHGTLKRYLPDTAERKSQERKGRGRKTRYIDKQPKLKAYIEQKLKEDWSPEQIAGRMPQDIGLYLNYESIYQYVYSAEGQRQDLRFLLRRRRSERRMRHGRKLYRGVIPGRVDIDLRPESVDGRRVFGHWEGDSMLFRSQSQILATQVERKSRFLVVLAPPLKTANARRICMTDYFRSLPESARRSLTVDNGWEFSEHKQFTDELRMPVYFAKPYAAYQRGTNEHHNGLLRWYLPRQTDIKTIGIEKLEAIVSKINHRPRKCLGFLKPIEVFYDELKRSHNKPSSVALRN
jgi:transposase, IS30 family